MLHCGPMPRRSGLSFGLAVLAWLAYADQTFASENVYYVSSQGDDAWSGRLADPNPNRTDGPWKTLAKACVTVQPGDICRLREGVYREMLKPLNSETQKAPIVFEAQIGETVQLSGADPIDGWEAAGHGLFRVPLERDLKDENQLFVGDSMLTEARWMPKANGGSTAKVRHSG